MPISVRSPRNLAGLAPALRALVRAALASEGRSGGEIGVALADDTLLRALNRDYRGLDKTTDVLSFGYDESGELVAPGGPGSNDGAPPAARRSARPDRIVNGDLVISMDRVREQARRFRVSEGQELARLIVHGALHLAGLDHRHDAERRAMRVREDAVLKAGAAHVRVLAQKLKMAQA